MRRLSVIEGLKSTSWMILGATAIAAASAAFAEHAIAAEAAAEPAASAQSGKNEAAASSEKKPARRKKARGRLPAHFTGVVTEEQREQIYAIQKEFDPKIKELRTRLDALAKARDEKIYALLTPEQKKKIDDRKAAAKQARAKKKAAATGKATKAKNRSIKEPKEQPAAAQPAK